MPGLFDEIIVDLFAGGGGMSTGIEIATGRTVDEAVNHDRDAIVMHQLNHPNTRHWHESVLAVDPIEVAAARPGGRPRPVGLLHASPDCTHFSMARGGKPVKKEIRGLAWVVCKWAAELARHGAAPRIITMENVREFLTWGPLVHVRAERADGAGRRAWMWEISRPKGWKGKGKAAEKAIHVDGPHKDDGASTAWMAALRELGYQAEPMLTPDKRRSGETFAIWKSHLEGLGYRVETRVLDAADYGAPTHRRRLFIVARRDGRPIRWPEKTHGNVTSRTPSVEQEAGPGTRSTRRRRSSNRVDGLGPPQASRTGSASRHHNGRADAGGGAYGHHGRGPSVDRGVQLESFRTAAECIDFSLTCPSIFGRSKSLAENTLRRIVRGLVKFVLESADPFIVQVNHSGPEFHDRYGERPGIGLHAGQDPRCRGVDRPLGAITGTANGANLVLPYLVRHRFGEVGWAGVGSPLQTICAQGNHFSLIAPHLIQFNGEKGGETRGQPLRWPLNTVPTENRFGLAAHALAPWLCTNVIGQQAGRRCDVPAGTITTVHNKFQLVTPYMVRCAHGESSASGKRWGAGERDLLLPLPTVTGSKDFAAVTPFLAEVANSKWGVGCRGLTGPMPTITAKPDGGSWAAVAPLLTKFYGMGDNVLPANEPVATITSRDRFGLAEVSMAGWVVKHYGGHYEGSGIDLTLPLHAITACDHHALGSAWLTHLKGTHGYGIGGNGLSIGGPIPTLTAGNHLCLTWADAAPASTPTTPPLADLVGGPTDDPAINAGFWRVYALLRRFLGDEAPLPFVHKRDADGNLQTYLIHDIGMRMLTPRELLNAQFGPELAKDYILTGTRESQVAKIGNSVPPYLGAAVVRANWHDGEEHDGEVAA